MTLLPGILLAAPPPTVITRTPREEAWRRAIALDPENAEALNALAWELALEDRAEEALPLANRAVDLVPWSASVVDTLAQVAARLHRCAEALQLEHRAILMSGHQRSIEQNLLGIEARCPVE